MIQLPLSGELRRQQLLKHLLLCFFGMNCTDTGAHSALLVLIPPLHSSDGKFFSIPYRLSHVHVRVYNNASPRLPSDGLLKFCDRSRARIALQSDRRHVPTISTNWGCSWHYFNKQYNVCRWDMSCHEADRFTHCSDHIPCVCR